MRQMASEDIPVLTLILSELSDMRRENADFRREMKQDMQDFKTEMKQDMQDFKAEIKQELAEVKTDMKTIQVQMAGVQDRLIGLEHDTAGLVHWNYWILTLLVALIAAPQILTGIRALFGAVAEGVSAVLSAFRKGDKSSG